MWQIGDKAQTIDHWGDLVTLTIGQFRTFNGIESVLCRERGDTYPISALTPVPSFSMPLFDDLSYGYGFELTFHDEGDRFALVNRVNKEYKPFCRRFRSNAEATTDSDYTIEVRTPVLFSTHDIRLVYEKVTSLVALPIRSEDYGTGGGHIHISPIKGDWTTEQKFKMLSAIANQPFITWAFADPEDDAIHDPLKQWKETCQYYKSRRDERFVNHCDKGYSISNRQKTMEWRLFAAPENIDEQLAHVHFVDTWTQAVLAQAPVEIKGFNKRCSQQRAEEAFFILIGELGLKPQDYDFTRRNFELRWCEDYKRC